MSNKNDKKEAPAPPPAPKPGTTLGGFLSAAAASAIGGGVHALIEQPITTPIEASITQTQINGKNFVWNFKDLASRGIGAGLYRSFPTALAGAMPKAVVHYGFLNYWINFHVPDGDIRKASKFQSALIGASTGASEVCFTVPLNFVKFRMQRPEWGYTGMFNAISTIYKTEGPLAFWKGTEAVFCRNTICMVGMVYGYKEIEERIPATITTGRHFAAGAMGGVLGSFLSYPFEMLRAAKMHNRNFYEEMLSQGPKRMLAGWLPGATRLVLTGALMGEIMPFMKEVTSTIKTAAGVA